MDLHVSDEPSSVWPDVERQPDLPAIEQAMRALWAEHDVFHTSMERRKDGPTWTFYEGPPTANGMPGTHHVEARAFKDIFPRYQTMKGRYVRRKAGWDCHGLPVELEVEKELGLNSKRDIEEYGIEEFNARCRESVTRYTNAWQELTDRIGFWVDMEDAYRTMDPTYVDSLWWALKELWDRDLIFEDFRVTPYCARCGTGLSDAEVAQGYRTVEDPSIFVRMPILDGPLADRGAALLIWTTTPWTLSNNAGVVVGPEVAYQLVERPTEDGIELLVIAADRREAVLGDDVTVVEELAADDLAGLHYAAPFSFTEYGPDERYVLVDEYVTTTEGTGLVHISPGFGAEDHAIVKREGMEVFIPVDLDGQFTHGPWTGTFVKDADPAIIEALREDGRLLKVATYEHTYPFCWRCDRPLIYYAKPSWYIRTTAKRDELLANNAGIDWHPEHIRDGRFGNWLANNVDWALSRDRYWGTPLPFWRCGDCDHVTVVASRAELSERTGGDHAELDPHRPYVDAVTLPCEQCGQQATRVPDVADTWFDSGGMPYAQWGYPHTGTAEFERHFPADYICEAIDQTRGWFYTLLAESTLLFDQSSYDTCLVLGHIVDEDGRKMSKSRGNILDPWEVLDRHGADALRWLMFADGNPWVNRRVGHTALEEITRQFLLTLWNTHVFFLTYARIDGFTLDDEPPTVADRPAGDRWVLAELASLVETVDGALAGYDASAAARRIEGFVDDLSNWYLRRNRRRFWKAAAEDPADKAAAYHTLHTCLTTLAGLLAPFTPFIAERLWQDLAVTPGGEVVEVSVHLTDFPTVGDGWADEDLRSAMATARRVTELGRQARQDAGLKVRQPLARALVTVPADERTGMSQMLADVAGELNIREVDVTDGTADLVDRACKPNFRELGPAFQQDAPTVAAAIEALEPGDAGALATRLDEEGAATIETGVGEVTVSAEMVQVVETPRTGWAVASDGATSVALDTELDDSLLLEGAARELVRAVNDLRKQAGLALEDRIAVALDVADELGDQLEASGGIEFLAREVLADEVTRTTAGDGTELDLGELGTLRVAIATS